MKFWVTLDDHEAEVEFTADGGRLWLEVEGDRIEADFARLPDGEVYSLLVGGKSHEVRVSPENGRLDVTLNGALLAVEVRHPLEKALARVRHDGPASGDETIVAPMPGLIVALHVGPGDRVEPGQSVVVIEAMKMQNELSAKHGGIVKEVLVAERASVASLEALIRITGDEA
jgi:biotin carboxyl carrier protein